MAILTSIWRRALDFTCGYGVRVARVLHVYVLVGLLSFGVFLDPRSVQHPLEWGAATLESPPAQFSLEGGQPGSGAWGTLQAFWMATRLQVPFIALYAEHDWRPSIRPVAGMRFTYEEFASAVTLLNYVLVPLLIAGATGILKKA